MAVQLILGGSGSGKSHFIYHKIIEESIKNPHRDYLLLVPEQFTMQTQKEVTQMHPGGGILNIDVLSFQRLAYRVFEEVGGDSRLLLEETGKTLVLEKVVQNCRSKLKYLGSQMGKPGYIQEMKSLISELMQYDMGELQMKELLAKGEDKALLHQKLTDVNIIYGEFRKYLRDKFLTGEEVLEVLCERLPLSEKLKGSTIVFDGFTGFTPLQYKALEQLMCLCPQVYVTVTLGEGVSPFGKWQPYELFAMSRQMIQTVKDLAVQNHISMEEPVRVMAGVHSRFAKSPALMYLEQNLFRYGRKPYEKPTEEIELWEAINPLEEMRGVSRRISRLVRQEGFRYGDIAVITGDLDTYGNYGEQVFRQTDIPCFVDRKHSVLMNPFVEYVRSALDVMVQNFSYASVFRHLRSGLSDVTSGEIDRLENYAIAMGIDSRKRWQEPWVRVYRGMAPQEILEINEIRSRSMERLFAFADAFKVRGNCVEEDVRALYSYIAGGKIQEKLKVQEQQFAAMGDRAMEKEYAQIYGIVMNLLDKLVEILGVEKISQKEFVQLMEAGLSEAAVGIIPPSTDQVLIGDMERTRLKDIKALFFVGVNDGIIPKSTDKGGILSDQDREFFKEEGISLAPTPREAIYMQRFYLYLNLTKPSEYLFLSYSLASAGGDARGAAYLIETVEQLFSPLKTVKASAITYKEFERPLDSLSTLVEGIRQAVSEDPGEEWKELYTWFASQPEYEGMLRQLTEAAFYRKPKDCISKAVAKVLYGEISLHSATRLERFAACAFAHFLRYGLALRERERYEFTPMDMGNVMHNALENFSKIMKEKGLEWKEITTEQRKTLGEMSLSKVVDDYGNTILHSSARNEYMIQRVRRIFDRTLWALQKHLDNSEFHPEGFEVSIGGGRIDRLDICETEDKVYVKVMDYKTGGTTFDLLGIYHGLQLQLMVYLDGALEVEQRNHPGKEIVPAGVFYYNVKDPMLNTKGREDTEAIAQKLLRELSLNGLASADREILNKMDATLDSLPVTLNKDGSFSKRSMVAKQDQFTLLGNYVDQKIRKIKEQIEQGEAEIAPYQLGRKEGCTYCPYSAVCGFDQKIPGFEYRRLKQFSPEELWGVMEMEADNGCEMD